MATTTYSSGKVPSMQKAYDSSMLKDIYEQVMSLNKDSEENKNAEDEERKRKQALALSAAKRWIEAGSPSHLEGSPETGKIHSIPHFVEKSIYSRPLSLPINPNVGKARLTPLSDPVAYAHMATWQKIRKSVNTANK